MLTDLKGSDIKGIRLPPNHGAFIDKVHGSFSTEF